MKDEVEDMEDRMNKSFIIITAFAVFAVLFVVTIPMIDYFTPIIPLSEYTCSDLEKVISGEITLPRQVVFGYSYTDWTSSDNEVIGYYLINCKGDDK